MPQLPGGGAPPLAGGPVAAAPAPQVVAPALGALPLPPPADLPLLGAAEPQPVAAAALGLPVAGGAPGLGGLARPQGGLAALAAALQGGVGAPPAAAAA
eukprot:11978080-Heterocapsa_arctica.AAC.1